jgi:alpha-L-fucosidase 2
MTYRPFTLEGNFLAMEAVHEMLLQSWASELPSPSAKPRWGAIRIFPAMPWRWHEASYENLRAEGGHRVAAKRENNATTWFRIVAACDGVVRIRDNFGGREHAWNRKGVRRVGEDFEITLRRGQTLEATLPKPTQLPPAPADVAEPVGVRRQP